jgi:hypothetical protein
MKKNACAILQRQQQRKARHTAKRQAHKRSERLSDTPTSRGEALVCELFKTIHHFFPDLFDQLRQLEDCRGKSDYTLVEILMGGIALFLFQQGSRNALNNKRQEREIQKALPAAVQGTAAPPGHGTPGPMPAGRGPMGAA